MDGSRGAQGRKTGWSGAVVLAAAAACASCASCSCGTGAPDRSAGPGGRAGGEIAAGRGPAVFTDVTRAAGIDFTHIAGDSVRYWLPEEMGAGGACLDFDGDGDLDLYLVQSGALGPGGPVDRPAYGNHLYRNDGGGRFTDVTAASGAGVAGNGVAGYGMGCAAADADNDGDVDLYVTRLGPNVLLRNEGDGRFTDVTAAAGVGDPGFGTSAAFFDYDRDGRLDLYVANYVDWAPQRETVCYDPRGLRDYCNPNEYERPSSDRLYHGLGGGRFEDASARAGIAGARGNGLGVVAGDWNGDGWLDLYVANDQTPAFLWVNQGDGTFVEDAGMSGCAFNADGRAIAGMGVAAEDLDGDGDDDLVITNICKQAHLALRNDGGLFADLSHAWGFGGWGVPHTGFGLALFDQDLDGGLDGYVANGAVNRLSAPGRAGHPYAEPDQFIRWDAGRGRCVDASAELGAARLPYAMSRGVLAADIDNDGDIDLVVTANRGPARLLRNDDRGGGAWIELDLVAASGCRNALNARLEIEAGGRRWRRTVRPQAGYLGSNDPRVHAGLGRAAAVERLRVTWVDGSSETWTELPVRARLRLRQGAAPAFERLP